MFKQKSNIIYFILSFFISFILHPLLLIPTLFFWIKEHYNYKIYNYNIKDDYIYNFNTKPINIKIENNKFKLPDYIDNSYTIILKVDIKSNFISKLSMPSIKISNNINSIKQYFEYYAQGIRYLNISPLVNSNNIFSLSSNHCKLQDKDIEIYITKNISLENKTILFLSPHPDDAEIAGYGLYKKYHQNSYIVNISAGDSGTYIKNNKYISKDEANKHKGKLRLIDSLTTPLFANIPQNHIYNLAYKNDKFKDLYKSQVEHKNFQYYRDFNINKLDNIEHTWDSLLTDLTHIIQDINPDIIITPHPQIDSNNDHKYTTLALKEVLDAIKYKNIPILLYSNHLTNTEAYPFGEQYSIISLPPSFNKDNFYFEDIYNINLSDFDQIDKYYALESIHDIRLIDINTTFISALKFEFRKFKKKLFGNHFYYYRKAVRCNELFFVINKHNLNKIIETIK